MAILCLIWFAKYRRISFGGVCKNCPLFIIRISPLSTSPTAAAQSSSKYPLSFCLYHWATFQDRRFCFSRGQSVVDCSISHWSVIVQWLPVCFIASQLSFAVVHFIYSAFSYNSFAHNSSINFTHHYSLLSHYDSYVMQNSYLLGLIDSIRLSWFVSCSTCLVSIWFTA